MDDKTRRLLSELPDHPPRSKLQPYWELIRELRNTKNWTYDQIADYFLKELKIPVAPSTIHNFLKVRSRDKLSNKLPAATMPEPVGIIGPEDVEILAADSKTPMLAPLRSVKNDETECPSRQGIGG